MNACHASIQSLLRAARGALAGVLAVTCCAAFLHAAPSPVPDDDFADDSTMGDELSSRLTVPLERQLTKFDTRVRLARERFGATSDGSTLDLGLVFEDEAFDSGFTVVEGEYFGSVFGVPAFIEVLEAHDARPMLTEAMSLPEYRLGQEAISLALATDSQLRMVDIIAISQETGTRFSSRVLHWTPPQAERRQCLGFPDSEGQLCGISFPLDLITPEDMLPAYPEFNPIIPASWSFPDYVRTIRHPERMNSEIEYYAQLAPVRCMSCPTVPRGICIDEFLSPGTAAHLALAEYNMCIATAWNDFLDADMAMKLAAAGVVAYACFGIEIIVVPNSNAWKVKFPKRPRLPRTWQGWALCGGASGVLGLMIWSDYQKYLAAVALCNARFAKAIRDEFDRICAEP